MKYQHTQRSPLHLLLYTIAIVFFVIAWQLRNDLPVSIAMAVAAIVMIFLALSFQTLTVAGNEERIDVSYGPLKLFGTSIRYQDITEIELGQTSFFDGWGIHFIPFRGWTFNLWGFECIKISLGNQVIRLGTNDSKNLARFLNKQLDAR